MTSCARGNIIWYNDHCLSFGNSFFVVVRVLLPLAVPQTTKTRPVRIFGAHGSEATAACRSSDDCKVTVKTRVADWFASHQTGIRTDGSGHFRTEHTGDSDFRGHASSAVTLHQYICWCLHNQNRRWYNWDWCCDLLNNYSAIDSSTKVTVCGEIVVAHENVSMTNISKESTGFVDISEEVATKVCPRAFADLVASSVAAPQLSGDLGSFVDVDVEEDHADSRVTPKLSMGWSWWWNVWLGTLKAPDHASHAMLRSGWPLMNSLRCFLITSINFYNNIMKNAIRKMFSSNSELSFVVPYQKVRTGTEWDELQLDKFTYCIEGEEDSDTTLCAAAGTLIPTV